MLKALHAARFVFISKIIGLFVLLITSQYAAAQTFNKGDTIFVAFPSANIKDDAFIVGKVTQITAKGDYQISVLDYVEGHDYGSSCVPISKNTEDQGMGSGWELWQDTTRLNTRELEYIVPKESAMKLGVGKHFFVERNNLSIVFGRWKSDAPMLTVERLERAKREAKNAGLNAIIPAFKLAQLHRQSFYGDFGRPLMAFESVQPLNTALSSVFKLFEEDPELESHWRANPRNWQLIGQSSRHYFLIDAIDKLVADARAQQYEEGVEQAGEAQLKRLKEQLSKLQRR